MIYKIRTTWALAQASWEVLIHDRELLTLPVIGFIISLITAAGTSAAVVWAQTSDTFVAVSIVLLSVAMPFFLAVVAVFFNGALVAGAHTRLTGGDPTVKGSIAKAGEKLFTLILWGLLTSCVGSIMRMFNRGGCLAHLLSKMGMFAWETVAFLTIPAIVIDDLSTINALKRSAQLLRNTWGENLISRVGFGFLAGLMIFPVLLAGILLMSETDGAFLAILVTAIGLAGWVTFVAAVFTSITAIYQTALYMYAANGNCPSAFNDFSFKEFFETF